MRRPEWPHQEDPRVRPPCRPADREEREVVREEAVRPEDAGCVALLVIEVGERGHRREPSAREARGGGLELCEATNFNALVRRKEDTREGRNRGSGERRARACGTLASRGPWLRNRTRRDKTRKKGERQTRHDNDKRDKTMIGEEDEAR